MEDEWRLTGQNEYQRKGPLWVGPVARSGKLVFYIILLCFLFLSSCGYGPRISHIDGVSGKLYVVTDDWTIRVFDVSQGKWQQSTKIPVSSSLTGTPRIKKIIRENGSLFIQIPESVANSYAESVMYIVQGDEVRKIGRLPYNTEFLAADKQFLYFAQLNLSDRRPKGQEFYATPFRYDKQMRERKESHFESYPDLVVADICESGEYTWYACTENPVSESVHVRGPLVLVRKLKSADTPEIFRLIDPKLYGQLNNLSIASDPSYVWIIPKVSNRDGEFVRFSRTDESFDIMKIKDPRRSIWSGYCLLAEKETSGQTNPFWLIGQKLFQLDRDTFEIDPIPLPDDIDFQNNQHGPAFSDDKNLWITLAIRHKSHGWTTDHLLRISKADLRCKLISVDRFTMVSHSILSAAFSIWQVYPILAVATLVFGVVLGLVNIRDIRKMKGRAITAWLSAGSILVIVCSLWFENMFDYLFIPILLLLGVTTILLSRAFTYLVKQMRNKLVSWILALAFSFCSGLIFFILNLFAFRFISGESGLLVFIFLYSAAIAVGATSLIVNIVEEVKRGKREDPQKGIRV